MLLFPVSPIAYPYRGRDGRCKRIHGEQGVEMAAWSLAQENGKFIAFQCAYNKCSLHIQSQRIIVECILFMSFQPGRWKGRKKPEKSEYEKFVWILSSEKFQFASGKFIMILS